MKPIPAIVEPAQLDIDLLGKQLAVALASKSDAERVAERHEKAAETARAAAKARRLEVGQILCRARPAWPDRGPNAKGWGEFLAKHGLDDATARRYMDEYRDPAGFAQKQRALSEKSGPPGDVDRDVTPVNGNGGSGDPARGTYCTPEKYALAVGPWDIDPFSNPRSHVVASQRCMLEDGGDGLLNPADVGSFRCGASGLPRVATHDWRVFIQPPYSIVEEAIAHYGHTRFCALLRFDPSTDWFAALWKLTRVVAIPFGERIEFEGPPDIETSANPYPHAFYYADERDVTAAIRELCIVLRVDR